MKATIFGTEVEVTKGSIEVRKSSSQAKDKTNMGVQTPPYDPVSLTNLYEMNSYHARSIQLIAALTCMLGYNIVNDDRDKEPDEDYNAIEEFLSKHVDYKGQPWLRTIYNFMIDYKLFGYNYLEIVRSKDGNVAEFYHLPVYNAKIYVDSSKNDMELVRQEIAADKRDFVPFGTEERGELHEYLSMKNYTPRSIYYGIPDYIAAIGIISLDRSAVEYNIRKFENNAVPDTIISVMGEEVPKGIKGTIKDFFGGNFKGVKNTGRALVLETTNENTKIDVKPVGAEVKEASFQKLRSDNKEEIAAAHGVPPRLLGIMTAGSLGGESEAKQQMQMFRDLIVKPLQKDLEFLINDQLISKGLGIKSWRIEFESFDIDDAVNDADFFYKIMQITDAQGNKVLEANEIREELGYKPMKMEAPQETPQQQQQEEQQVKEGENLIKGLIAIKKKLQEGLN